MSFRLSIRGPEGPQSAVLESWNLKAYSTLYCSVNETSQSEINKNLPAKLFHRSTKTPPRQSQNHGTSLLNPHPNTPLKSLAEKERVKSFFWSLLLIRYFILSHSPTFLFQFYKFIFSIVCIFHFLHMSFTNLPFFFTTWCYTQNCVDEIRFLGCFGLYKLIIVIWVVLLKYSYCYLVRPHYMLVRGRLVGMRPLSRIRVWEGTNCIRVKLVSHRLRATLCCAGVFWVWHWAY